MGHELSVSKACSEQVLALSSFSARKPSPHIRVFAKLHIDFGQFRPGDELGWCTIYSLFCELECPLVLAF